MNSRVKIGLMYWIDEIIRDLYFGMFRPYDLYSVQAQTMLNSILESMPDAWNDRQPELKAMNPEGWEIAMVLSLIHI